MFIFYVKDFNIYVHQQVWTKNVSVMTLYPRNQLLLFGLTCRYLLWILREHAHCIKIHLEILHDLFLLYF